MTVESFDSDGVEIAYLDAGEGPLVVLVHGFASNHAVNWVNTSWVKTIVGSGHRAVAIDNRGHGRSQKLYESALYEAPLMAQDVIRLLDHLGADRATLFGYSMGARICTFAVLQSPHRASALIVSGLARALVDGVGGSQEVSEALLATDKSTISDPKASAFRAFAEQTGSDKKALAACILASRQRISEADVGRIAIPTLVVAGENDEIAGSADWLAARIPGAEAKTLPGRDHMTAVGDKTHKETVLQFLASHGI
ncbi:MAG: alpha/beta hydrolase [Pseudomonadota bacterium]